MSRKYFFGEYLNQQDYYVLLEKGIPVLYKREISNWGHESWKRIPRQFTNAEIAAVFDKLSMEETTQAGGE